MHRTWLVIVSLAACDIPSENEAPPAPTPTPAPTTTGTDTTLRTDDDAESGTSESTGTGTGDLSTSGDESTGEPTSGGDESTTSDDTTGTDVTGEPCEPQVDVLLSIDVSDGMTWPLQRLAYDLPALESLLHSKHNVDVRWAMLPWIDVVLPIDDLSTWGVGSDAYAARSAVSYWSDASVANLQPDFSGPDEEQTDAGVVAFVAAAAHAWRPGAVRVALHITDSPIGEKPAVLSGHAVDVSYTDASAALDTADVHVLAWAPAGEPGYAAPYGEAPALASVAFDVAAESDGPATPDAPPLFAQAGLEFIAARLAACP